MPTTGELKAHIEAVLKHLEGERDQSRQQVVALQARIRELDGSILTLKRSINSESTTTLQHSAPRPLKYANISVRWAILDLLRNSGPMTTSELADALIAGGVQTRAANFTNNVSAVLSTTMKEQHSEVQQLPDSRWELTDNGIGAIEYIRTTPKFRRGVGSW